jgi:hypothetical protein
MGNRQGTCILCGDYFTNSKEPYICNTCRESKPKKYICMVCGRIYIEGQLPIKENVDGCCKPGSLIETYKIDE